MQRDLRGLELVALMIDGVHFADHVVLAAIGIDPSGEKHPLGLREGATENAAACTELLADLIERGLDPNRALLVVIDGAKALRKAVLEMFGERALIHRCQQHKKRNVTEALPARMRSSAHSRDEPSLCDAGAQARAPSARESRAPFRIGSPWRGGRAARGPEETLTVMRLGLPESLERVLSSTNLIENLSSRVREVSRWSSAGRAAA